MNPEEELKNAEAFIEKLGLKCKVLTLEDFRAAHAEANGSHTEQQPVSGQSDTNALAAQLHAAVATKDATKVSLASGNSQGEACFPQVDTATDTDALLAKLAEDDRIIEIRNAAFETEMWAILQERNAAAKADADAASAWKANVDASLAQLEATMVELLCSIKNGNSVNVQCPGDIVLESVCRTPTPRQKSAEQRVEEAFKEDLKIAKRTVELSQKLKSYASEQPQALGGAISVGQIREAVAEAQRDYYAKAREECIKAVEQREQQWRQNPQDGIDQIKALTHKLRQSAEEIALDHMYPMRIFTLVGNIEKARNPLARINQIKAARPDAETLQFSAQLDDELRTGEMNKQIDQLKMHMAARRDFSISLAHVDSEASTQRDSAWKADANVEACVGELLRIVQNKNSEHVQCPLRGGLNIYAPGDVAIMRWRRISVVSRHQENVKECTAKIAPEDLEISEQAVALAKKAELERADKALLSRLSPQLTQKRRSAPRPRTEANVKADAATDAWLRSAYGRLDGIDQIAAITKELRRKQSSDELRTGETTAQPDQLKVNMAARLDFSPGGPPTHVSGEGPNPCLKRWTKYPSAKNLYDTGEVNPAALPSVSQPALKQQVGGNHYKDLVIQPVEYCQRNGLGFCESSVVKYVSRYKAKNGVEDLRKARHFLDLLIEMCEKDAGTTYCIKPIN